MCKAFESSITNWVHVAMARPPGLRGGSILIIDSTRYTVESVDGHAVHLVDPLLHGVAGGSAIKVQGSKTTTTYNAAVTTDAGSRLLVLQQRPTRQRAMVLNVLAPNGGFGSVGGVTVWIEKIATQEWMRKFLALPLTSVNVITMGQRPSTVPTLSAVLTMQSSERSKVAPGRVTITLPVLDDEPNLVTRLLRWFYYLLPFVIRAFFT